MSKMNINLVPEEMKLLEVKYVTNDGTGKTLDYLNFVKDVDIVFTKPNL